MTYKFRYKMILLLMMMPVLSLADDGSIQKGNLHQGNNLHYTLTAEGAVGTGVGSAEMCLLVMSISTT